MYELFEHTADLGLRVLAADLDELFAEAGRGLLSIIADDPAAVRAVTAVPIHIEGTRLDYLLFDWLNELLAIFETRYLLLGRFEVRVGTGGLDAVAHGETLDRGRHRLLHEVKAITYHGLSVQHTTGGWHAEVIVDI